MERRKRNPDQARERRKAWWAGQRDALTDRYLAKLLTERGWPKAAITPELLALKREQLQTMRLLGEVRDVLEQYAPPPPVEIPASEQMELQRLARNAAYRARYAANREKERARIAAYKAANPDKVQAQRERAKARKQGQNFAPPAGESRQDNS